MTTKPRRVYVSKAEPGSGEYNLRYEDTKLLVRTGRGDVYQVTLECVQWTRDQLNRYAERMNEDV